MWATLVRIVLVTVLVVAWTAPCPGGPRVQVRGTSRLDVRASGPRDRIQVSGTLRDETGTPIPDALLVVSPMMGSSTPMAWQGIADCSTDGPLSGAGLVDHTATTDSVGGFCLVGALPTSEASIRIVYGGGPLHDGTRNEVLWNARRQPSSLRFAPRPERIDLDAERVMIFARVTGPEGVSTRGLPLRLTDGDGGTLASARTDESGAAHFDFPSSKLPGPGIGTLRAAFDGRGDLAAATATATVTRSVRVRLRLEQDRVSGDPSRGVLVGVHADTSRGPAQGGTVEAVLDQAVVGAAPVVDGTAEVISTFRPRRETSSYGVSFRYRPDTPYYEASGTAGATIIAEQPSPWLRSLPIALAVVVAAWLLRGWWRPKRRDRAAPARPGVKGQPSLEVLRTSPSRDVWSGRVVDAHDGQPIGGARVRVIVPTFVDLDVVVDETTDEDGTFSFQMRSAEKELRLRVESTYHAEMERPLPPPSDVVVALMSRRRLLLDRLVGWARRAGKPWHREPEPTPGHVHRVAKDRRRRGEAVAAWAQRVQQGAYGPDPVDQEIEREVRELEPGGQPLR